MIGIKERFAGPVCGVQDDDVADLDFPGLALVTSMDCVVIKRRFNVYVRKVGPQSRLVNMKGGDRRGDTIACAEEALYIAALCTAIH